MNLTKDSKKNSKLNNHLKSISACMHFQIILLMPKSKAYKPRQPKIN